VWRFRPWSASCSTSADRARSSRETERLQTLAEYIQRILELVDLLGEDHVRVGTDMDANYKPVFETYAKMPLLIGGLSRPGMPQEALAKLIGDNFLRVFAEALMILRP
jgi:microsomal dipeptidase-like Zn-dependent dipeptidase